MVISMEEYRTLREEFLKVAKFHINTAALNDLKKFYKGPINSVRTCDNIKDIQGLIRVLEKRNVIRYNNIAPLKYIAKLYLSHSSIKDKLEKYDIWVQGYNPPYPPQTNLYKLGNGEFYRGETNTKNLHSQPDAHSFHSNLDHDITHFSHRQKFNCESPRFVLLIDDDSSDCNNSVVSVNSVENPIDRNNYNNHLSSHERVKCIKNCTIHIVSEERFNLPSNEENNPVSSVPIPTDLINETERNIRNYSGSTLSSTEDISRTDKSLPNTPLLATPQSVEPQIKNSNSLNRTNSIDNVNVKTLRSRFENIIKRRYVRILSILSPFAIILITIIIVYGFLKNPVNYNPQPSAPTFQEISTSAHPGGSGYPNVGYNSQLDPNRHGVCNFTIPINRPLQTLSQEEAELQNNIFGRLSKRMGHSWRDVARQLDIRECDINDINERCSNLEGKAYAALVLFASETNLRYWKSTLKKALEKSRRKDLADIVEDVSNFK